MINNQKVAAAIGRHSSLFSDLCVSLNIQTCWRAQSYSAQKNSAPVRARHCTFNNYRKRKNGKLNRAIGNLAHQPLLPNLSRAGALRAEKRLVLQSKIPHLPEALLGVMDDNAR